MAYPEEIIAKLTSEFELTDAQSLQLQKSLQAGGVQVAIEKGILKPSAKNGDSLFFCQASRFIQEHFKILGIDLIGNSIGSIEK